MSTFGVIILYAAFDLVLFVSFFSYGSLEVQIQEIYQELKMRTFSLSISLMTNIICHYFDELVIS